MAHLIEINDQNFWKRRVAFFDHFAAKRFLIPARCVKSIACNNQKGKKIKNEDETGGKT